MLPGASAADSLPVLPTVTKFPAPLAASGSGPNGMTFDGRDLWFSVGGTTRTIFDVATDGTVRASYAWPGNQLNAVTSDGRSLWADVSDQSNDASHTVIQSFTLSGVNVVKQGTIPLPVQPDSWMHQHDLAHDGSGFWWSDGSNAFLLDPRGTVVGRFGLAQPLEGIEWDGKRMWLAYADPDNAEQSRIAVADRTGHVGTTFTVPIFSISTLAYGDGALWAVGWDRKTDGHREGPLVFRLDASKADSSAFRRLTVTPAAAQAGVVTSSPDGIRCGRVCSSTFPLGTTVTLTAEPGKGLTFGGWHGGCRPASNATCKLVMNDASTIAPVFRPVVTVVKEGDGTIASAPFGIACGGRCSSSFVSGTKVTLQADPTTGSFFAGWGGACTGRSLTCVLRVGSPMGVVAPFRSLTDLEGSVVQVVGVACAGRASTATSSYGTGVILGDHFVATVDHVVANLQEIDILERGTLVAHATVIGRDPDRDLALLRTDRALPNGRQQAVTLADRPPRKGEAVAAIGYTPDAPPNVTLTKVTGTNVPFRVANVPGLRRLGLLELRAPVDPGNSGGLLVSSQTGEVVGIVDMRTTVGSGKGYAVSATTAKPLFAAWSSAPQPPPAAKCR